MVNVFAVDCDEEQNKQLCADYKVQGFPTIKIMRAKVNAKGRKVISTEDYVGPRTTKAIVDHATSIMPSRVERVTSDTFSSFLDSSAQGVRFLLFTAKGRISPIYKAISTSYSGDIAFGQVRDTQEIVVQRFNITEYPKLVAITGTQQSVRIYDGHMKLSEMKIFVADVLANAATQEPAPIIDKPEAQVSCPVDKAKGTEDLGQSSKSCTAKAESSSGARPRAIEKLDTSAQLIETCLSPTSRFCVLIPEGTFASTSSHVTHDTVQILEYSSEVKEYLEEIGVANDKTIFVNGKKNWFIAAKRELREQKEVLEFVDLVLQGGAGRKIRFENRAEKDEL